MKLGRLAGHMRISLWVAGSGDGKNEPGAGDDVLIVLPTFTGLGDRVVVTVNTILLKGLRLVKSPAGKDDDHHFRSSFGAS